MLLLWKQNKVNIFLPRKYCTSSMGRTEGPTSLQHICLQCLAVYKHCLGDIGDIPVDIIWPVLKVCNAEELATIEDATSEGGRSISGQLQHLWHALALRDFGSLPASQLQEQPEDREPACWRAMYLSLSKRHYDLTTGLSKRLRAMTKAEQAQRQSRKVQVLDKPPPQKTRRTQASPASPSRARSAASSTRLRLLGKLGLTTKADLQLATIRPARGAAAWTSGHHRPSRQQAAQTGLAMPRRAVSGAQQRGVSVPSKAAKQPVPGHAAESASSEGCQTLQLVEADIEWAQPQPAPNLSAAFLEDETDDLPSPKCSRKRGRPTAVLIEDPDFAL